MEQSLHSMDYLVHCSISGHLSRWQFVFARNQNQVRPLRDRDLQIGQKTITEMKRRSD